MMDTAPNPEPRGKFPRFFQTLIPNALKRGEQDRTPNSRAQSLRTVAQAHVDGFIPAQNGESDSIRTYCTDKNYSGEEYLLKLTEQNSVNLEKGVWTLLATFGSKVTENPTLEQKPDYQMAADIAEGLVKELKSGHVSKQSVITLKNWMNEYL